MPVPARSLAIISAAIFLLPSEAFAQAGPCDLLLAGVGLTTPKSAAIAAWNAKGMVEIQGALTGQTLKEGLAYQSADTPSGKHGYLWAKRIVAARSGDIALEFAATYTAHGKSEDWKAWPVADLIQSRIDAFCGGKSLPGSDISCELNRPASAVTIQVSPPLDAPRPFCSYILNVNVAARRPGKVGGMREELKLRVSPMSPKERQMLKAMKKRKKRKN